MKKLFLVFLLVVFVLTACGGGTQTAPSVTATNTKVPPTVTTAPTVVAPTAAAEEPATPTSTATVIVVTNPPDCTNRAEFVADMTVPDYAAFTAGETIHKVWRVKNTGTCTWTSEYALIFSNGNQMSAPNSIPLETTAPGATLDVAVDMTAPGSIATYRAFFEMHTPSGAAIPIDEGTYLWLIVNVVSTTADAGGSGGGTGGSGGGTGGTTGGGIGLVNSTCAYTTSQANVDAVIAAINSYRAQNGLPPFTVNSKLTVAAQSHSADMACNQLFYHNGSNGSSPLSRVGAAGYSASSVSENVYGSWPPLTGQGVVTWWANDQGDTRHNANLVSTKYTEIGVGYSFYNNYGYYVVVFAVP